MDESELGVEIIAKNLAKIIKAFPQYTCYIFDLDPKGLPEQILDLNGFYFLVMFGMAY
jgi:hypothetical protein